MVRFLFASVRGERVDGIRDYTLGLKRETAELKGQRIKGTEMALKEIHPSTKTKCCLLHIESTNGKPLISKAL